MRKLAIIAVVVLLSLGSGVTASAEATFQGIGDLLGGDFLSYARALSPDGLVVVGNSSSTSGGEAFRWEVGVMTDLGDLSGGEFFSAANGVSAHGSVVVGSSSSALGYREAFHWEAGEMIGLGDLLGGQFESHALNVSSDGSVIVGYGSSVSGEEAFRWEAGVMSGLGDLPGGKFESRACDVSSDGSIVVGYGHSTTGPEAFRWKTYIMTGLGDLPGGDFNSKALGMSADGSVVVGESLTVSGWEAFLWEDGEMIGLGDLPGGQFQSCAYSVSADGSVVVGMGYSDSGTEAFIWDADKGMRRLQDVLVGDLGLDLTGWTLRYACDISDDGLTIVGWGINPEGNREGWIVTFPGSGPSIIYVDADSPLGGDGLSWNNAHKNLQDGLKDAYKGDEIRVAEGEYQPDSSEADPCDMGDREVSFQLVSGVVIKGGYAGYSDPDPCDRDIVMYETILSGDLKGNDREVTIPDGPINDPCRADNSYHVITCDNTDRTAALDGFTITGGNGNGAGYPVMQYAGGGTYHYKSKPTLINCTFVGNCAIYGAGMFNYYESDPEISHCIFRGNFASSYGGGIRNYASKPRLNNCIFSDNSASSGGGLYNYFCTPTLRNCTFYGNSGKYYGGGIYNYKSYPVVANCILWNNEDRNGTGKTSQIYNGSSNVYYSCVQGWIGSEPLFADPDNGDYHLKSTAGRWEPVSQGWVFDDVSSTCIDGGSPFSEIGDEPAPNGNRINIGAYGGTEEASKSICDIDIPGDINGDCVVDLDDFALLCHNWLTDYRL